MKERKYFKLKRFYELENTLTYIYIYINNNNNNNNK